MTRLHKHRRLCRFGWGNQCRARVDRCEADHAALRRGRRRRDRINEQRPCPADRLPAEFAGNPED